MVNKLPIKVQRKLYQNENYIKKKTISKRKLYQKENYLKENKWKLLMKELLRMCENH